MTTPNNGRPGDWQPNNGQPDQQTPGFQQPNEQQMSGFQQPGQQTPGYQQQPYAGAGVPAWQPPAPEKKGKNVALRILIPVVAALAAVGASLGVRAFFNATAEPSPSALATEAAKQVNENYTFPLELPEVTRWDGVTADGAQLDYAYTIDSSIDPASLTAADLKSSVVSNVCQKKESRDLLSKAIVMRYSYVFDGTDRTIDFAVTNADC
ncbi:hypothetical protein NS263_10870 [Curtobacterium oceanosedimentum]|uniref:DUF4333 domain-containing protein n=1 Tax=Curtobacterium oceanosedimentum TaxID=465820 RepID=A0ABR5S6B1_9MICO|nr:hypothetical protein [Curtobacterium oceanosedimentum]KTR39271.1 hypothetical protein NS263_10870 [Curtobacterium oceanosedimentum]